MNNNRPNFLIVGAPKAGTTSLANYLNEHKDVYIPPNKELRYFISDSILNVNKKDPLLPGILKQSCLNKKDYYDQFHRNEIWKGEASVQYLFHYEEAIPKILEELGDIPIIIMLRDPIKRAFSNWKFIHKDQLSFPESILEEEKRRLSNFNSFWYYKSLGFYYLQVKAYLENFSKVKVIIFEEFIVNPQKFMDELCELFDIEKYEFNTKVIYNKKENLIPKYNFISKNQIVKNFFLKFSYLNFISKKFFVKKNNSIPESLINELKREYENDRIMLEILLNKKLPQWV